MKPTVGRIVHTRLARGEDPVPAIITRVYEDGSDRLDVCAFGPYPTPLFGAYLYETEEEMEERGFYGEVKVWWPPREQAAPSTLPPMTQYVPIDQDGLISLGSRRGVEQVVRTHSEPTMVRPHGHPTIELRFDENATPEERGEVIKAAYALYPDHRVVVVGGQREVTR